MGFGGLWRFAGPFSKMQSNLDNAELFVNCLEAMVETCLPVDEGDNQDLSQYPSTLSVSSAMNLSSSMSSLTLGSPTDKDSNMGEYHVSGAPNSGVQIDNRVRHVQLTKQRSFKCKTTKNGSKTSH